MEGESTTAPHGHIGCSILRVAPAVYAALRAHGERTYPRECCGALLGRPTSEGWQVHSAVPASNTRTQSAHTRYEIAPEELVRIERDARRRGLEIAGFYHSHPDHPAHWSATDLAEAHWIGCCYVITSVIDGKAAITNAFLLSGTLEEDKGFKRLAVVVEESRIDLTPPRV